MWTRQTPECYWLQCWIFSKNASTKRTKWIYGLSFALLYALCICCCLLCYSHLWSLFDTTNTNTYTKCVYICICFDLAHSKLRVYFIDAIPYIASSKTLNMCPYKTRTTQYKYMGKRACSITTIQSASNVWYSRGGNNQKIRRSLQQNRLINA